MTDLDNGRAYTFAIRAKNGVSGGVSASLAATPCTDYDQDDDGLIEVINLAQLNAIRWDLDGDGSPTKTGYADAFPTAASGMGCPVSVCTGYELTTDLDFDTGGSGLVDAADDYWNDGAGWEPFGDSTNNFSATFHGKGNTISNLLINRGYSNEVGLFGDADSSSEVRHVSLVSTDVTVHSYVGGLVGSNEDVIFSSSSAGSVTVGSNVGGLVGNNDGMVTASYATSDVTGLTGSTHPGGLSRLEFRKGHHRLRYWRRQRRI